MDDYVEVPYASVVTETDGAVLFEFEDGEQEWVPRSLFEDHDPAALTISLATWKAEDLGLYDAADER